MGSGLNGVRRGLNQQHGYEKALERAGVMVFEQDCQLRYTRIFNPAPPFQGKECLGHTDAGLLEQEVAFVLTRIKQQVLQSEVSLSKEVSMICQGRPCFFSIALDPMVDDQGVVVGLSGSLQDLTAQKETRKALHESEERFQVALRGSRTTVFTQDLDLRYTWMYTGTPDPPKEYYEGKTDYELHNPRDREVIVAIKEEVLRTGKSHRQEITIHHEGTDGDMVYDLKVDPMTDAEGNIVGVIGAAIDITGRKQTEKALRWERELLEAIFDSIPVMLTLYDPSIENLHFNRAFHQITGWTEEDVQRRNVMELAYPDPEYRMEVAAYMQSLEEGFKDLRMVGKDGIIIESSWANIRLHDGRQVGIGMDITQRKQAEQALRESEERFATAFRTSPEAMIITRRDNGQILDVNDAWTRIWGYSREESIGNHTTRMKVYADPRDRRRILEKALENGYVENFELELHNKKGEVRQALFSVELMKLSDGQLMLSLLRDITEDRRYELERERLLEENQGQKDFLETLLENTMAGIAVVSGPELRFTLVNKAYQALRPELPMVGNTYAEVFPMAVGAGAEEIVRRVVLTGETYENRGYPMPIPGKRDATWDHHIMRLPQTKGKPPAALIITWDTTSHQRLVDELARANQELESFSYSVSHDLRSPLLTIGSFTRFLLDDYGQQLDHEGHDYLKRITQGVDKMQQLIDDMLVLSRLGRQELRLEPFDLSKAIHHFLEELQLREPQRTLKASIEPGMRLRADRRLMQQVVENLLGNAWKYSRNLPVTEIEAGTMTLQGQTVFFIRDHGVGFNSQYARKIFEPFRRFHSDQEFPGSGVGLSIVYRVIRRHGGRIWARSQEGEGATFFFSIE